MMLPTGNGHRGGVRSMTVLAKKLIETLKEEKKNSFCRNQAEKLGVSNDVISTIMSLEHQKAMRKRAALLGEMDECKERIFKALKMGTDEEEDLSMFAPSISQEMLRNKVHDLILAEKEERDNERWLRHIEQSEILNFINAHINKCKENAADMDEMVEWMTKFTFEVSWEDIEMSPIEEREEKEELSFKRMVSALQQTWSCTKKLTRLIEMLSSDDQYDYMAGKIPKELLSMKKRKIFTVTQLWSSSMLRTRMNQYEKLRSEIKVDPKKPELAAKQRKITVLTSGETPGKSELKKLEAVILSEISESWKEACGDVAFYMKETFFHNFTKPSCKKRLKRALLLLEFFTAAIEGKMKDADKTLATLHDSQIKLKKMKKDTLKFQRDLIEKQKELANAKQTMNKLKNQIKSLTKENEKLTMQTAEYGHQVKVLEKSVQDFKTRPSKDDMEKHLNDLEKLERELNELKANQERLKIELNLKIEDIEKLKQRLATNKKMQAELKEELASLKQEKEAALKEVGMLKEKLSLHDFRVKSLQDSFGAEDKEKKERENKGQKDEPVKLKTLSSAWSIESQASSQKQTFSTSRRSTSKDSTDTKTESSKKLVSLTPLEEVTSEEEKTEIGFHDAESSSSVCTKRDSSMLQALQEMMSLIQAQTDQVAIAAEVEERMQTSVTQRKSTKRSPPSIPQLSSVIQPEAKRVSTPSSPTAIQHAPVVTQQIVQVQKVVSPQPIDFDLHLQNFATMLTQQLTQVVDKDDHYQSNDDKVEAGQELQLLFQSAKQAMKSEAITTKRPQTINKKPTQTSPEKGSRQQTVVSTLNRLIPPSSSSKDKLPRSQENIQERAQRSTQIKLKKESPNTLKNENEDIPFSGMISQRSQPNVSAPTNSLENYESQLSSTGSLSSPVQQIPSYKQTSQNAKEDIVQVTQSKKEKLHTLTSVPFSTTTKIQSFQKITRQGSTPKQPVENLTEQRPREQQQLIVDIRKPLTTAASILGNREKDQRLKIDVGKMSSKNIPVHTTPTRCDREETTTRQTKLAVGGSSLCGQGAAKQHVQSPTIEDSESLSSPSPLLSSPDRQPSPLALISTSLKTSPVLGKKSPSPLFTRASSRLDRTSAARTQRLQTPPSRGSDRSGSTGKRYIKPSAGNKARKSSGVDQSTSISFDKLESFHRRLHPKSSPKRSASEVDRVNKVEGKPSVQRVARLGRRRTSSLLNGKERVLEMAPLVQQFVTAPANFQEIYPVPAPKSSKAFINPSLETGPVMQVESNFTNQFIKGKMPEPENELPPKNEGDLTSEFFRGLPPQAENFARRISEMISNYFTKLNITLIESLKREKLRLSEELKKLEFLLANERIETQAKLDALYREKLKLECDLNDAKKTAEKLLKYTKYSSLTGSFPKILSEYVQEKTKLIEISENLNSTMRRTQSHTKLLEQQLQVAELKVKKREKNIQQQDKKLKMLREKLTSSRQEEIQRLFMSLRNHRVNYKTIVESMEINPDVKMGILDLLRQSMSYPKQYLGEILRRYIQKREIDACMQKIQLQLPEVVRLPPMEMSAQKFKETFDHNERKRLRQILTRLKKRSEDAEEKWKVRVKEMTGKRQKILNHLALMFHKLNAEYKNINLIHPNISKAKVSERPESPIKKLRRENAEKLKNYENYHHPVTSPQSKQRLRSVSPNFSGDHVDLSQSLEIADKTSDTKQPFQMGEMHLGKRKQTPESPVSTPFRNMTGTACLYRSSQSDEAQTFAKYLQLPVLSKSQVTLHCRNCQTLGIPKLLEMDVQSGLRNAKKILFTRTQQYTQARPGRCGESQSMQYGALLPLIHGRKHISTKMQQVQYKHTPKSSFPLINPSSSTIMKNTSSSDQIQLFSGQ